MFYINNAVYELEVQLGIAVILPYYNDLDYGGGDGASNGAEIGFGIEQGYGFQFSEGDGYSLDHVQLIYNESIVYHFYEQEDDMVYKKNWDTRYLNIFRHSF